MAGLLETLAGNLLVAAALAGLAALAARARARPALVHGLWLLVLVKLVTPGVWRVPLGIGAGSAPRAPASVAMLAGAAASPLPLGDALPSPLRQEPDFARRRVTDLVLPMFPVLPVLWALGAGLFWGVALLRAWGFARVLRFAGRAPPELLGEVRAIARRLDLPRLPEVRLLPGRWTPMLWAPWGRAYLVLPADLWKELDAVERRTLLAHELAHLGRRDHLVRHLELLVLGVHFWNPLAWLAARRLRAAEEACCDAWVVWALPEAAKSYADALVRTAAFLSERGRLPAGACGLGKTNDLEGRLTMILERDDRRNLGRARLGALVLAAGAVAFSPALGQDARPTPLAPPGAVAPTSAEPAVSDAPAAEGTLDVLDALLRGADALQEKGDLQGARTLLQLAYSMRKDAIPRAAGEAPASAPSSSPRSIGPSVPGQPGGLYGDRSGAASGGASAGVPPGATDPAGRMAGFGASPAGGGFDARGAAASRRSSFGHGASAAGRGGDDARLDRLERRIDELTQSVQLLLQAFGSSGAGGDR